MLLNNKTAILYGAAGHIERGDVPGIVTLVSRRANATKERGEYDVR